MALLTVNILRTGRGLRAGGRLRDRHLGARARGLSNNNNNKKKKKKKNDNKKRNKNYNNMINEYYYCI